MAYIYDLSDTWNAGGTTFYGIKLNVTNSASAAGSRLISLQVSAAIKLAVDKDGNFGLGTDTLAGPQNSNSHVLNAAEGYHTINHVNGSISGSFFTGFAYNGGYIGSITQSGTTAVLYNTTSDERLKENIDYADDAGALIDLVAVRKFDWRAGGAHQRYGFVAQELYQVFPEAVHAPDNQDEMMAVDYSKLVPMLVKEVQSLRTRVSQLEGV